MFTCIQSFAAEISGKGKGVELLGLWEVEVL